VNQSASADTNHTPRSKHCETTRPDHSAITGGPSNVMNLKVPWAKHWEFGARAKAESRVPMIVKRKFMGLTCCSAIHYPVGLGRAWLGFSRVRWCAAGRTTRHPFCRAKFAGVLVWLLFAPSTPEKKLRRELKPNNYRHLS